jgi:hypothetical protein
VPVRSTPRCNVWSEDEGSMKTKEWKPFPRVLEEVYDTNPWGRIRFSGSLEVRVGIERTHKVLQKSIAQLAHHSFDCCAMNVGIGAVEIAKRLLQTTVVGFEDKPRVTGPSVTPDFHQGRG